MAKKLAAVAAAVAALPAGFRAVQSGSFPQVHDWKKNPVLQGTVMEIKTVAQKRGKKLEDVPVLVVADSDGVMSSVWHSAALDGIMKEAKVGEQVYLRFNGVKKLKGRKTLKDFTCGILPGAATKKKK